MAFTLGGCQIGTDRPTSFSSPPDSMTMVATDFAYQVVLNGEDVVRFSPPLLTGSGRPHIEVSEEDGQ
jgi:hypothetical protein